MSDSIQTLIDRRALFVCNHSGGKDSQAMLIRLRSMVPDSQLLIVHAHLPEVEWEGTEDHVRRYAGDIPVIIAEAVKTFFEMVKHRGQFPSPQIRQCTSDLKRGPIEREIRRHLKANPRFDGLIVNCMGMRSDESSARAKLTTFNFSARNSKAGREWYDWLPIHYYATPQVFAAIADAGQEPHGAYALGMTRLSCRFCIMSSRHDLRTAARHNPNLFERYVETEKAIGQTMFMPSKTHGKRTLEQVAGITVAQARQAKMENAA